MLVLAAACSSSSSGVSTSAAPSTTAVPHGYKAMILRVTDAAGGAHEWCVLVAETEAQKEHGLMGVDSLGGYDGMLFRFDSPVQDSFYMFRTRIPLSIAFFDTDGAFVSTQDMPPCTASKSGDCPLYGASGSYTDALEAVEGGLPGLGIGPGSHIAVGAECTRP
jgi:uncharacterized membrane protein (UPF0127 family)